MTPPTTAAMRLESARGPLVASAYRAVGDLRHGRIRGVVLPEAS